MSDSYEDISFGKGPLDVDLLQKLVSNGNYLYEHMFTGFYSILGVVRETGLTFRIGHVKLYGTESEIQIANVYFTRPFLPGMRPVVFTSVAMDQHSRFYIGTKGLDGRAIPDHRGFQLIITQDNDYDTNQFQGEQYVSYLAIAPSG